MPDDPSLDASCLDGSVPASGAASIPAPSPAASGGGVTPAPVGVTVGVHLRQASLRDQLREHLRQIIGRANAGDLLSQTEVATLLRLSRQSVHATERRALIKIRRALSQL